MKEIENLRYNDASVTQDEWNRAKEELVKYLTKFKNKMIVVRDHDHFTGNNKTFAFTKISIFIYRRVQRCCTQVL